MRSFVLCDKWLPQHLCLTLSDLTSQLLVLQHSCMHQNSWAPIISNFVFILQIFRLTPQNLQKLLISPMSLLSIMNSLMFSAKLKLKFSLLIVLMISKSIWKVLNLWLVLYTLFWHLNKSVIATTRRNGTCSMLTSAKLSVGYLVVGITRELNKEPSLY